MARIARGDRAPAFVLPSLAGGQVDLPGPAPLTLLAFTKASCPTCRWVAPFLQGLHERARGLTVVGVASDPVDEVRAFAEELGLGFPVAVESAPWEVSAAYGLTTVPTLILVDGDGTVLLASEGFARDDFLEIARTAGERSGTAPADPFPAGEAVPALRPG